MRLLTIASLLFLLVVNPAFAQEKEEGSEEEKEVAPEFDRFNCSTEISYKWEDEEGAPQTVKLTSLTRQASTEELAKDELSRAAFDEESVGMKRCKHLHESTASCVSSGLRKTKTDYAKWDFITRKAYIDSLTKDCKNKQGKCIETSKTEIVCAGSVAPKLPEVKEE